MPQRSQVFKISPCFLNIIVIVNVKFGQVMSPHHSIECLSECSMVVFFNKVLEGGMQSVSDEATYWDVPSLLRERAKTQCWMNYLWASNLKGPSAEVDFSGEDVVLLSLVTFHLRYAFESQNITTKVLNREHLRYPFESQKITIQVCVLCTVYCEKYWISELVTLEVVVMSYSKPELEKKYNDFRNQSERYRYIIIDRCWYSKL